MGHSVAHACARLRQDYTGVARGWVVQEGFAMAEQRRPNTGDDVLASELGYSLSYLAERGQEKIRVLTEARVRREDRRRGTNGETGGGVRRGGRGRG